MKSTTYQPINCDFYDILEANATLKKRSLIVFDDVEGQRRTVNMRIINLYAKEKEEFMELEDGTILRLDSLISVDGQATDLACGLKN